MKFFASVLFCFFSCTGANAEVLVPQGIYQPIFREPGESDSKVGPLLVDRTPVTNHQFLEFIKHFPRYKKSKIKPIFADAGYLSHWNADLAFKTEEANFPVTFVSWFVARKYCEAKNKRLPTIAEWEYFSDAQNSKSEAKILEWYSRPDTVLRNVGSDKPNRFGLRDLHGHIWEWVDNFSETIMSGDSRGSSSKDALFCGGAALKAKDPRLYAAFLRFAFRSSIDAKYASKNLGFRCVKDI